ncbi:MAG: endonuclease/exonuclease/phosphatase family protein [Gaiellaceae bacterium]
MPLLVRTWNLFHGNADPPGRHAFLEEMVRLVSDDRPDAVCLQEVPVWAWRRLGDWSGMEVAWAVGVRPRVRPAGLGRRLTAVHHGLLRSAFTGEGVAILTAPGLAGPARSDRVGPGRAVLSLRLADGPTVACFHVTGGADGETQLRRAVDLLPADRLILAGDANREPPYDLDGFSSPLPGSIDQILVRGLPSTPPAVWPDERRRHAGRLLSDHAPVELRVG